MTSPCDGDKNTCHFPGATAGKLQKILFVFLDNLQYSSSIEYCFWGLIVIYLDSRGHKAQQVFSPDIHAPLRSHLDPLNILGRQFISSIIITLCIDRVIYVHKVRHSFHILSVCL